MRLGNWLSSEEAKALLNSADIQTVKGKRSRAILAVCLGCGLRRSELAHLTVERLQKREDHWAIVDLMAKVGHMRTIPIPDWVKVLLDVWIKDAGLTSGRVFRRVNKAGRVWG